jgi:tetratricopeptide (TPR) repeat protein/predicted Ser/Thr protein kinase
VSVSSTGVSSDDDELLSSTRVVRGDRPEVQHAAIEDGPWERSSLGRYVTLEVVGRGGMGIVHRAYDPVLRREVAIKRLRFASARGDATPASGAARLLREAQVMAQLSHPNVLPVYDVTQHDDVLLMTMEFVDGRTLREWLREQPRMWREVLDVFLQAGAGLAEAHHAGIVHRDFKPTNVLVGTDGRVRVMDFGIARAASRPGSESAVSETGASADSLVDGLVDVLTCEGTVLGTPPYMAPEQHEGRAADARSDQYAFCVALWEGLFGQRPWTGGPKEILAAKRHGPPPPPSRQVPRYCVDAVQRGLAADPNQRHASMDVLLDALRIDPGARRRRALWIVGGAGALVATTAIVASAAVGRLEHCGGEVTALDGSWDDGRRARAADAFSASAAHGAETWIRVEARLDRWSDEWRAMHREACEATHVHENQSVELLDRRMACLDRARERVRALVDRFVIADRRTVDEAVDAAAALPDVERCGALAALQAEHPPPTDPHLAARVQELRAALAEIEAVANTGDAPAALTMTRDLLDSATDLDGYPPVQVELTFRLGRSLHESGDFTGAERQLRETYFEARALGLDDIARSVAIELGSVVGHELGRVDDGLEWIEHARAEIRRRPHEETRAILAVTEGLILFDGGRHAESEALQRETLAGWEQPGRPHHPLVASALSNLAGIAIARGDNAEAETIFRRVVELERTAYGPQHPRLSDAHTNLGVALAQNGSFAEAAVETERALKIREQSLGPTHPDLAISLNNLGNIQYSSGDYVKAVHSFERSIAIVEKSLGADSPRLVATLGNLGYSLVALGRADEALPLHRRALAIAEATFPAGDAGRITPLVALADIEYTVGEIDAAAQGYERALALSEEHPDLDSTAPTTAMLGLGRVLRSKGRPAEAVVHFQRALQIRENANGPEHPGNAPCHDELGRAAALSGDHERALASFARSLAIIEATHGPDHVDATQPLIGLAEANLALGRAEEARPHAERAAALQRQLEADPLELVRANFVLARVLRALGETDRVRALIREGRATCRSLGDAATDPCDEMAAWAERQG